MCARLQRFKTGFGYGQNINIFKGVFILVQYKRFNKFKVFFNNMIGNVREKRPVR